MVPLRIDPMKQNLTISLEKALIKKAKILAAQKETSVTGLLSEFLKKIVYEEEAYEKAKQKALEKLAIGYSLGGRKAVLRDELHER
jgi:hypothetical protein